MGGRKDWSKDPKGAYEHVFINQKWGNSLNSGKNYSRPYDKTKKSKEENE